eukprot:GHVS01068484.1.p2 GENE.GHVS01068484.1~~GHVS01068484.1.p2  ORF type:complete len:218 (-),score=38.33 GHVS01068484.1:360-1013(-)
MSVRGVGRGSGHVTEKFQVAANGRTAVCVAVVMDDVDLPLILGIQAIKELQLTLDFAPARGHPVCPVEDTGGGARQLVGGCGGLGDQPGEKSPTKLGKEPEICTDNKPQQPIVRGEGAYLTVAFVSTKEEEAAKHLEAIAASMSPSLTSAQKADVIGVLKEFQHTWLAPPEGGGACSVGTAQLEVSGRPIKAKSRPLSDPLRRVLGPRRPSSFLWDL